MGSSSMKVQHYSRGFWDNNNHQTHESQPMTLGCKRFRPLAPKVTSSTNDVVHTSNFTIDLKTFIRPESGARKLVMPSSDQRRDSISHQVESQGGGTRWNPTQEQIGILEMLYKQGMRTPNAEQIERITEQLSKYGKIEGKNVFYWFQNHKARERQRQKRNILGLPHNPRTTPSTNLLNTSITLTDSSTKTEIEELQMNSPYKRKFRSWTFDCSVENSKNEFSNGEDKTLELFPLHPEGLIR